MSALTTTLTVRLTADERQAAEAYARKRRLTLTQLARESIVEKIEDACDLNIYAEGLKSNKRRCLLNPFWRIAGLRNKACNEVSSHY